MWRGRLGCVPVAVRWRLVNGAEWLDACVFVAVGAQQAKTHAASTSIGQIEMPDGKAVGV